MTVKPKLFENRSKLKFLRRNTQFAARMKENYRNTFEYNEMSLDGNDTNRSSNP